MNRTAFCIYVTAAMFFAPNALATFISTQDAFTFSTDFDITVTTPGVTHQETLFGVEAGNGWDILADVVLNSRDRLNFVFEVRHDSLRTLSAIPMAIIGAEAGDFVDRFPNGDPEFVVNHGLGQDIYEFNYTVTGADRSVMDQITVRGNAVLRGRHLEPSVATVAEPATFGLLGVGLIGLVIRRRR